MFLNLNIVRYHRLFIKDGSQRFSARTGCEFQIYSVAVVTRQSGDSVDFRRAAIRTHKRDVSESVFIIVLMGLLLLLTHTNLTFH